MKCEKCGMAILGTAWTENDLCYHTYCAPSLQPPHWGVGIPHPFPQDNPGMVFVSKAEIEQMILKALATYHQTYHIGAKK